MLAGEGPAVRGSAPLRGGRWRGHPLTACVALHEMVRLFKNRPFHCRKSETVTPLTLIFAANVRLQSWIGCAH
jgi:hypothetical protein